MKKDGKYDNRLICVRTFYNIKIWIGTDGKLPDDISFKDSVLLIKCVTKDNWYYPQIFLKVLYKYLTALIFS